MGFNKEAVLFPLIILLIVIAPSNVWANAPVQLPKGLSDTAFERSFDNALRDIDKDQNIKWDSDYATPNSSQLFEYLNNFSKFTTEDTSVVSGSTRTDTELIKRPDVPVNLYIIQEFNSSNYLIDYRKEVTTDESL